ncbi:hypothetical protein [Mucilaginibacter sp.]|uniref:hypothetical protein n=1 Tax=Mucilaginibacter sp. TaxID=1882438 RepID=UPI00284147DB|nr:hypothetical protein [Mucilaginibacter sp.]MDR3694810.1 hypothetical protein [Mucilaginibacter sp.]
MKALILCFAFAFISFESFAAKSSINNYTSVNPDSVKLTIEGIYAFYQGKVKVDSLPEGLMYVRAVQFMAAKNFQQNYGYQEEGKMIYFTTQDLNVNEVYVGDDDDVLNPYTVQFSMILDLKNGSYRYTINNVVFFRPDGNGNKRETLYDVYLKATNTNSRRIAKDARKLIDSFEKYLNTLTGELYDGIEQKPSIYSKF